MNSRCARTAALLWRHLSNTNNLQGVNGGQQTTNWTYVVCSHDGSTWRLFVNGSLVQSSSDPVGALNWPAPWRIGTGSADGSGRMFAGNITQVALYNYRLSAAQVYAHYFAGQYGTTPSNSVPIITAEPADQSCYAGGSVQFKVGVLSVLPTTNQWFKGAAPLVGQRMQPSHCLMCKHRMSAITASWSATAMVRRTAPTPACLCSR